MLEIQPQEAFWSAMLHHLSLLCGQRLCTFTQDLPSGTCIGNVFRRAGQHPPNLQKIYPAQAKRVRKAPQRYSGEEAQHPTHPEDARPAHQPRSHSGPDIASQSAVGCCPLDPY